MRSSITLLTIVLVCCYTYLILATSAEYDNDNNHHHRSGRKIENRKDYKLRDKDVKQAKARWISLQEEDWGDDMWQKPIDEPPRRTHRELGEMCTYSRDCQSGCCLLERSSKLRSCQPKSVKGEKCSNAQVKADIYVDACPCFAGYSISVIILDAGASYTSARY
ncbi:uncharacterized protein LOC128953345 [Oppia nitens]|uniref:uncharacterized protein LOC128953345 n=1 Tax=Oppia nitens TaxID=1686743 RepID=UPI0023DC467D|nr:uncharacterized protein LOC128953345 [Oppia nitens]